MEKSHSVLACIEIYRNGGIKLEKMTQDFPAVSSVKVHLRGRVGQIDLEEGMQELKYRSTNCPKHCGRVSLGFGTS